MQQQLSPVLISSAPAPAKRRPRPHGSPPTRAARRGWKPAALAVAGILLALVCAASPVQAATFKLMDGAISGSFDTTIGWGMSLRTSTQETRENTISAGNRIYDKWDIFTNTIKASHDLELVGDGWGVFVRGNYFYDKEADDRDQYDAARNRSVHHGDITDAYIWTRFGPSEQFTVRLGKQVISWGESTFIGGNLNDINTVDITKLRVPGVELKDAFVGTPAIHFAWQATDSLSVELFNLFTFDETKFDVSGSFFMTNDWISDGGGFDASDGVIGGSPSLGQVDNTLGPANTGAGFVPSPPLPPIGPPVAQFGAFGNLVAPWAACEPIDSAPAGAVSFPPFPTCSFVGSLRSADNIPNGSDQWGIAFRYYAANLLNGIEFGLFFERLHDHNGLASGYVGPNLLDGSRVGTSFLDYPKGTKRYGISFNTTIGPWAVSGEYGFRENEPIQTMAFLAASNPGLVMADGVPLFLTGADGQLAPGSYVQSYERYKRHQIQMTFQRLWGPMPIFFDADQWNTIIETAFGWKEDLIQTRQPGDFDFVNNLGGPGRPSDAVIATAFPRGSNTPVDFGSYDNHWLGLVARSGLTYNNALLNRINMTFNTALQWDIEGNSPEFGGGKWFIQGRKKLTVGFDFDTAQRWQWGISHTWVWGGTDRDNTVRQKLLGTLIHSGTDRDFLSFNASYVF